MVSSSLVAEDVAHAALKHVHTCRKVLREDSFSECP